MGGGLRLGLELDSEPGGIGAGRVGNPICSVIGGPCGRSMGNAGASAVSYTSGSGAPMPAAMPPPVIKDASLGFGVVERLAGFGPGFSDACWATGCAISRLLNELEIEEKSSEEVEGSYTPPCSEYGTAERAPDMVCARLPLEDELELCEGAGRDPLGFLVAESAADIF